MRRKAVGTNPYINEAAPPPPRQVYRLTVRNTGEVVEVNPECLPLQQDGQAGSILGLLLEAGIEIDHTCGGVTACSTCHIYVHQGGSTAPEPTEEEEDHLDFAPAVRPGSRLACQCVPDGTSDVEIEVPAWNRNEVSEESHS